MRRTRRILAALAVAGVALWWLWPGSGPLAYDAVPLESAPAADGDVLFTGGSAGRTVSGTVTSGSGDPVGCVLAVHGLGGTSADVARISDAAAVRGWRTLAVDAGWGPGFVERLVAGRFRGTGPGRVLEDAMIDVRRGIDWLDAYGDCRGRIVYVGVSLGAMAGVVIAAVDNRVDGGAFIYGGGTYAAALDAADVTGVDLSVWDPVAWISHLEGRPVVIVNARGDETIPPSDAAALHDHARPGARTAWTDGGHDPDATATAQIAAEVGALLDDIEG